MLGLGFWGLEGSALKVGSDLHNSNAAAWNPVLHVVEPLNPTWAVHSYLSINRLLSLKQDSRPLLTTGVSDISRGPTVDPK